MMFYATWSSGITLSSLVEGRELESLHPCWARRFFELNSEVVLRDVLHNGSTSRRTEAIRLD